MANTTIKTRVLLRNDDLSNWINSSVVLGAGEVALARREDGSYEMRVGDNSKTWTQLGSQNFMLSANQIIGLEQSMASLSTSHYMVSALAELSDSYNNGDTAVVKTLIADDKYSYTAYVYDGSVSDWKAMDGNYNAENVYFNEDMTYTAAIGVLSSPENGSATLSSNGKSLEEVFKMILAQTKSGTVTKPSITLTPGSTSLTGEVGSTYTVPKATLSFNAGSYEYDPKATQCSVVIGDAQISCADGNRTATNVSALVNGSSFELAAGTANAKTYTDSAVTYSYSASAKHSAGIVPNNNIGSADSACQISSATLTKTASCTATGKRKRFWYVGEDYTTAIDSAFLRATRAGHGSDFSTTTKTKDLPVPAGTKRVVFAFKGTATLKSVIDVDGMGLDIKDKFTTTNNVSVEGAASETGTNYTVFEFVNANGVTASTFKITLN